MSKSARYAVIRVDDPDERFAASFTAEQVQPMHSPTQPPGECNVHLNERDFVTIPHSDTLQEDIACLVEFVNKPHNGWPSDDSVAATLDRVRARFHLDGDDDA